MPPGRSRRAVWAGALVVAGLALASLPAAGQDRAAGDAGEAGAEPEADAEDLAAAEERLDAVVTERARYAHRETILATGRAIARRDLQQLREQLVARADAIQERERELADLRDRVAEAEAAAAEARASLSDNRAALTRLLMALQRLARVPREGMAVAPATPLETVRSALLLREAIPKIEARAAALGDQLDQLAARRAELRQRREAVSQAREELAAERSDLAELVAARRDLVARLDRRQSEMAEAVRDAARQAEDLRNLVTRLERERRRQAVDVARRAEERRQDLAPDPGAPDSQVERTSPAAAPPEPSYDGDPRAELRRPVSGALAVTYGEETQFGQSSDGVTYHVDDGDLVVAPLDGQVIFAGPFEGYGRIVILDNGSDYTTLLAGLDELAVQTEDHVLGGEPIGRVEAGADGGDLYLEFRIDGEPVNPLAGEATTAGRGQG